MEHGFLIFKPGFAVSERVMEKVSSVLKSHSFRVLTSGSISGAEVKTKNIFPSFFSTLAKYAEKDTVHDIKMSKEDLRRFETYFGSDWAEMVKKGRIYTCAAIKKELEIDDVQIDELCRRSKKTYCRLQDGVHCAMIDHTCTDDFELQDKLHLPVYVLNGFYGMLRSQYEHENFNLRYMTVEWEGRHKSWSEVHDSVIGCRDPTMAAHRSIRGVVSREWKALGLAAAPTARDNCVHMSDSAFRAFADRLVCVPGALLYSDIFGCNLIRAKIPAQTIQRWLSNPAIAGSYVFASMKMKNCAECIVEAQKLFGKILCIASERVSVTRNICLFFYFYRIIED